MISYKGSQILTSRTILTCKKMKNMDNIANGLIMSEEAKNMFARVEGNFKSLLQVNISLIMPIKCSQDSKA